MEVYMLGMTLRHPLAGIAGEVDGVSVDPAGFALVRICDHWFLAEDCIGA
jgi:hypothetical protein